jgi:hypothetical protein
MQVKLLVSLILLIAFLCIYIQQETPRILPTINHWTLFPKVLSGIGLGGMEGIHKSQYKIQPFDPWRLLPKVKPPPSTCTLRSTLEIHFKVNMHLRILARDYVLAGCVAPWEQVCYLFGDNK